MKSWSVSLILLFVFFGCATNPFTGKKTLAFVSDDDLFPMAFAQYDQVLEESKVVKGTSEADMIMRVGERIASAAKRWLNANGYQGYLDDYKWEYSLIDSDQVNAWCLPGGKIAFYTGILPIAENETGVAIIMGHEVAHALANHGQQRMSKGMLQQVGAGAVAVATSAETVEEQQLYMAAYGLASTYGFMYPYSRKHETEADKIGLIISAIAGYNPDEAPRLWSRMKANSGGEAPSEFFSTHPSNDNRIMELRNLAPTAKSEAAKFGVTSFRPINSFQ
ncbi:MAG: M48 family metallopeptidase [Bacteroidota bacterium]